MPLPTTTPNPRRTRPARRAVALLGTALAAGTLIGGTAAVGSAEADGFPAATVRADGGLNARSAPSVYAPQSYRFADGARISVDCVTKGSAVDGDRRWYLAAAEGEAKWVSGRYLRVHGTAEHCGRAVSASATTTEPTGAYEGPSTDDLFYESLNRGVGVEVLCFTDAAPTGQPHDRWMVTLDAGWIPASTLRTKADVPYCQQR